MVSSIPYTEKTSAADKAIGFDYQYYHFLWRLLTMKTGETVGLEVMDDVHTELANNSQILIQLKHSVQLKANGSPINLTELDSDLWKTLSNWSKVISDENADRSSARDQLHFIERTDFILVSNKSDNEKNTLLKSIRSLQSSEITFISVKELICDLATKTDNKVVTGYINAVLGLNDEVLEQFLKSIAFDLGQTDIIEKCKIAIKEHKIDESKIDEVFSGLDSKLREENFLSTQQKKKIVIGFNDFYMHYRIFFDRARNGKLSIKRFTDELSDKLEDQKFIRQLIDIQDIRQDDTESMAQYTRHLLYLQNNIDTWYKNGELTQDEINALKTEARIKWKNAYRATYRQNCSEDQVLEKALALLDAMRKEVLPIASQNLPTDMSNGQFYDLSNVPEIGWRRDWEEKYK